MRYDPIQRLRVSAAHENPAAMSRDDIRNSCAVSLISRRIGDLYFDKERPFGHGLTPVLACSQRTLLSRHALVLGRAETASFQRVSARCPSGIDMSSTFAKSTATS